MVEKDASKGFNYLLKAAEKGHPYSQHMVGLLYAQAGTDFDNIQSYKWLTYAIKSGTPETKELRKQLVAKMTPEQIQEAKQLVKDWQPIKRDFFY